MRKKLLYADTVNGKFDLTFDDVIAECIVYPTTDKDKVIFFDSEGCGYSLEDISRASNKTIIFEDGDECFFLSK